MAQRPIWRGHLRLALVSCPAVALYNAHHDRETLRFNLINPKTGHRIRMVIVDSETGEEVSRRDLVKGYEFKKDTYLLPDDEDFESVRVPSSTTMVIEKFVPLSALEPIYMIPATIAPDGEAGEDVFAVLRDAITESGKAALSHVVMARRERVVAIAPMGRGLAAHTLREQRDLNDAGEILITIPDAKSDPEMVKLARQLIDRQTGSYDPAEVEDRYEARLRELIAAKLKGEGLAEDGIAALNSIARNGTCPPTTRWWRRTMPRRARRSPKRSALAGSRQRQSPSPRWWPASPRGGPGRSSNDPGLKAGYLRRPPLSQAEQEHGRRWEGGSI